MYCLCHCLCLCICLYRRLFLGQAMPSHHSDQISQVSRVTLQCCEDSDCLWCQRDRQGHLLSCSGQLKKEEKQWQRSSMNIARMAASIGVDIHKRSIVLLKTRQQFPPCKFKHLYYGWPPLAMSDTGKFLQSSRSSVAVSIWECKGSPTEKVAGSIRALPK